MRTSITRAASETLCSGERGKWVSEQVPGPPNPGSTGLEGTGGKGPEGSAQSSKPRAKAVPYSPGLQEGQALRDGQGPRWLPWGQQGHWALALQVLPIQEKAGSQQLVIRPRMQEGTQTILGPGKLNSPWALPDHLDLGNHGCQEHPRKKWREAVIWNGP